METTRKTMKKPKTVVHKRIDYLGDGGTNDDATLTGDDKYRLYLDFTGSSEPIDVLFVIDTTSSMDSAMGSGDKTPRKTVVNNLMNGTLRGAQRTPVWWRRARWSGRSPKTMHILKVRRPSTRLYS